MRHILIKTFAFLCILSLVSPAVFYNSDPASGGKTINDIVAPLIDKDPESLRWMRDTTLSTDRSFELTKYDPSLPPSNIFRSTVTKAGATATAGIKVLSSDLSCGLIFNDAATKTAQLFAFNTASPTAKQELVTSSKLTTSASLTTAITAGFQLGTDCNAYFLSAKVYFLIGSTYTEPTAYATPAWTNPRFTNDFTYAIADNGLYKYTAAAGGAIGTWAQALALTGTNVYTTYKKIWNLGSNLVVFSYDTPSLKYFVNVYSGSTPALIASASMSGNYTSGSPPTVLVSGTLKTIVVYGKQTGGSVLFYKGKLVDYTTLAGVDITFPALITSVQNSLAITDLHLYARNAASVASKKHQGYYINGGTPIQIFNQTMDMSIVPGWKSSTLFMDPSLNFRVVHEFISAAKIITLDQTRRPVRNSIVEWDRTTSGNPTYSAPGKLTIVDGSVSQTYLRPNWFTFAATATANKKVLSYTTLDPNNYNRVVIDLEITSSTLALATGVKARSVNGKCAIVYDPNGSAPTLKVYYFLPGLTTSKSAALRADISTLLTTPIQTSFDVADDCSALKLGDKVFHWDPSSTSYSQDTIPSTLIATAPMFTADFSWAVNEGGIYSYTGKSGTTAGFYSLSRADTFLGLGFGQIWLSGKTLLIWRYKVTSDATKYDYKLQANVLVGISMNKVDQITGQSSGVPLLAISQKLTKVAVYGRTTTDATKSFYTVKNIDYSKNVSTVVTLPAVITGANNDISLSETFLYSRNLEATPRNHYAYLVSGANLTNVFTQVVEYAWTLFYKKTYVMPDASGRLTLLYQHDLGTSVVTWTRIIRDQRQSAGQVTNPTVNIVYQMQLDYSPDASGATISSSGFENDGERWFGRWFFMAADTKKINYITYDGTKSATGMKNSLISADQTAGTVIKAASSTSDCILTTVTTTGTVAEFNVYEVVSGATPAINKVDSLLAAPVSTDVTASILGTATTTYSVATSCWAFKVNSLVFLKTQPTAPKYTKSATASGWTGAVFDNSMRFAVVTDSSVDKIFNFAVGGSDYAAIVNPVLNLKTTRKLWSSSSGKTIVLLSYQAGTSTYVDFIVKSWSNTAGSTWVQNTIQSGTHYGTSTTTDLPLVKTSGNFETIVVIYKRQALGQTQQTATIKKLVQSSGAVTLYPIPPEFNITTTSAIPVYHYIAVSDGYVHLMSVSTGQSQQSFYVNNRSLPGLQMITKRQIPGAEFPNINSGMTNVFIGSQFVDNAGVFAILYQYDDSSAKKINIKKFDVPNIAALAKSQTATQGLQPGSTGYVLVGEKATPCPNNCAICSDPKTCIGCADRFVMQSATTRCLPCYRDCLTCLSSTSPNTCTSCDGGFFLANDTCTRCHDSCTNCTDATPTGCLACKAGSYLVAITGFSYGSCIACMDNCVQCTNTTCTKCTLGYTYNNAIAACFKCLNGCTNCKPENVSLCIGCADGFRATVDSSTPPLITGCQKCPVNCKSCNATNCTACRDNFRLSPSGNCSQLCRFPCVKCLDTDPSSCTDCVGGYTLTGSVCNPDLSCNTASTCTLCPVGYVLNASKCLPCTAPNCTNCADGDVTTCAVCRIGFYVNVSSSKCVTCTVGCAECVNQFTCRRCAPGYTLSAPGQASKCLKCATQCATCFGFPNNCDACATGYVPSGWGCVGGNRIETEWKVNGNFDTMTTSEYYTLQTGIKGALNVTDDKMSFSGYKKGSVILTTQLSFSSPVQQAAYVTSLTAAQSSGSVGGFTIQSLSSSSVNDANSVNGGSKNPDADYYKMIAIIVGIVIPVGIIIIFIIIIVLMRKGICCPYGPSQVGQNSVQQLHAINQKDSQKVYVSSKR